MTAANKSEIGLETVVFRRTFELLTQSLPTSVNFKIKIEEANRLQFLINQK